MNNFDFSRWLKKNISGVAIFALLLIIIFFAANWFYEKRENAIKQLEMLELRYARMLGVQEKQEELSEVLSSVLKVRANYAYANEVDVTQAAAQIQQELRRIAASTDIQVQSTQVQANQDKDGDYEKISLLLNASGQWNDIQLALNELKKINPYIVIDSIKLNLRGDLQASIVYAPTINMQISLSFYRRAT